MDNPLSLIIIIVIVLINVLRAAGRKGQKGASPSGQGREWTTPSPVEDDPAKAEGRWSSLPPEWQDFAARAKSSGPAAPGRGEGGRSLWSTSAGSQDARVNEADDFLTMGLKVPVSSSPPSWSRAQQQPSPRQRDQSPPAARLRREPLTEPVAAPSAATDPPPPVSRRAGRLQPAPRLTEFFSQGDATVAAFIFHEILEPPPALRRRR